MPCILFMRMKEISCISVHVCLCAGKHAFISIVCVHLCVDVCILIAMLTLMFLRYRNYSSRISLHECNMQSCIEYMGLVKAQGGQPLTFHTMNSETLQAKSLHLEKGQSFRTPLRQPELLACMCRPLSRPPCTLSSSFCLRCGAKI